MVVVAGASTPLHRASVDSSMACCLCEHVDPQSGHLYGTDTTDTRHSSNMRRTKSLAASKSKCSKTCMQRHKSYDGARLALAKSPTTYRTSSVASIESSPAVVLYPA